MSQRPALVPFSSTDRAAMALRDVCEETAYRLNVVLHLLEQHNCTDDGYDDDQPVGATGGFDLSLIQEELRRIRDRLREAS